MVVWIEGVVRRKRSQKGEWRAEGVGRKIIWCEKVCSKHKTKNKRDFDNGENFNLINSQS